VLSIMTGHANSRRTDMRNRARHHVPCVMHRGWHIADRRLNTQVSTRR